MSRKLGHPAPTALASHRAGLPGGRRGRRLSAHIARCPDCARVCAQLDAVTAALREAPRPSLPTAVEYRIVIAVTGEATRRQKGHPGSSRRAGRSPLVPFIIAPTLTGALAVCGCVLLMTRTIPLGPTVAARPPASRTARPAAQTGGGPAWAETPGEPHTSSFLVTDSNIAFYKATLRSQVRQTLAVQASPPAQARVAGAPTAVEAVSPPEPDVGSNPGPGPGPADGDFDAEVPPSQALVGCVLHLTGDVAPRLVDRGTYQSEQVYVIAVTDEAWVVGIGCTAARPSLITSVGLG